MATDQDRIMSRGRPDSDGPSEQASDRPGRAPGTVDDYLRQTQHEASQAESSVRFPNAIDRIKAGLTPLEMDESGEPVRKAPRRYAE